MTGRAPFSPGDKSISSDWLNDVDRARRSAGVGVDHSGGGSNDRITVLLTKKPKAEDVKLTVRRVRYNTMPPEECDGSTCAYEFASGEFDAYPDYGQKILDYEGDEWTGPKIDDEDTFLKAYREAGTWRLEKPTASAEIDYCVILQTSGAGNPPSVSPSSDPTLGAFRLRVQRVHLNDDGVYEAKGKPLVVSTRPACPGSLYDDYRRLNRNGSFTGSPTSENWNWSAHANMYTFQVMKSDGVWVCEQPPPMVTRTFPAGTTAGCATG